MPSCYTGRRQVPVVLWRISAPKFVFLNCIHLIGPTRQISYCTLVTEEEPASESLRVFYRNDAVDNVSHGQVGLLVCISLSLVIAGSKFYLLYILTDLQSSFKIM